jgi:pimeloyl-ACP methyl ester carboxylesterase
MLHEVVEALRDGGYGLGSGCSATAVSPRGPRASKVVLIGHSGGGLMVSGYRGYYDDVAAVVQSAWSNLGFDPTGLTPGHWAWNFIRQAATGSPYVYGFLDDRGVFNRAQCEEFSFHIPDVAPDVRQAFCSEPSIRIVGAPSGYVAFPSVIPENLAAIPRIPAGFPVMLSWPEFDSVFPPFARQAEQAYWTSQCRCELTVETVPGAGHPFQIHRSHGVFARDVSAWLGAHGM